MLYHRICSLFSLAALTTSAAQLSIRVPPSTALTNPSSLPGSTHATLITNNTTLRAPLRASNSFSFPSVPVGSYLLNVHCRDYFFEPLRIDVTQEGEVEAVRAWQTFRGNEWDNKGEERAAGKGNQVVDLEVRCLGPKNYYQEREGFNVLGFLKSPMILMALFSCLMIFGLPYIMDNIDPELRAEVEEMQRQSPGISRDGPNPAAAIQNFDFASWMAGRGADGGSAAAASGAQPAGQQPQKGQGQGAQKRRG